MHKCVTALLALAVTAAACGHAEPPTASPSLPVVPATSPPAPTSPGAAATPGGWLTDIDAIVPGMDRLHPQLDHGVALSELDAAAAELGRRAAEMTDGQILDGLMHVAALVSRDGCDAHTGAYVWGDDAYPLDSLPLRLWLFDEGVYVVDALDPYRSLIGSRVASIAGTAIADVISAVEPLIPRDNEWTVRALTPRYLLIPKVLAGVGVGVPDVTGEGTALETVNGAGAQTTTQVAAIPMADYNDWAGGYGLLLPADPIVPYLSRMDDELWWRDMEDGTLFIQYNQTTFVSHLVGDVREAMTAPTTKRVVLDVRHNTGGEVRAVDDLVNLFAEPAVASLGAPYVITGRNTFSAAGLLVARLQADAGATIVGEPMGACPTSWGNARSFELPSSGISVSVATQIEVGTSADDNRSTIEPDISVTLTEADWLNHRDPALAAIVALPQK